MLINSTNYCYIQDSESLLLSIAFLFIKLAAPAAAACTADAHGVPDQGPAAAAAMSVVAAAPVHNSKLGDPGSMAADSIRPGVAADRSASFT